MTYPDHMEDESLVELLKEGDHKAFELLFRKYYRPICAYASRFVDSTEVEDIADDCMVWIWEKRASLDIRQTFRQYLFTMVYHRAVKAAIRNRVADRTAAYMEDYRVRHELSESDFVTERELRERVKKAIDALPETYREAFIQHRFEGKSYKEIAKGIGKSSKTVDYRIQQALKQLYKDLSDYLPVAVVVVLMSYFELGIEPSTLAKLHEGKDFPIQQDDALSV